MAAPRLTDRELEPPAAANARWGMFVFIAAEGALLASLIVSYFYLRFRAAPPWPPAGIAEHEPAIPVAMTAILAASAVPMRLAEQAARGGRQGRLLLGLAFAAVLGAAFLVLQLGEWAGRSGELDPERSVYGSLFFTVTGFHALHHVAGLLVICWAIVYAQRGAFGISRWGAVANIARYWYFVVTLWLAVFASLYLTEWA